MANYIYGGIELPALPEWDRETYPYVILHDMDGEMRLAITPERVTVEASRGTDEPYVRAYIRNPFLICVYDATNEKWGEVQSFEERYPGYSSMSVMPRAIIWTPYDIIVSLSMTPECQVGDVFILASDPAPVPAYPPVTITWDGSVTTPNYNEYYCRVSERIFTKDELLGGTVVYGGKSKEYTIIQGMLYIVEGVGIVVQASYAWASSDPVLVTGKAGVYTHRGLGGETFTLPADGTYFVRQWDTDGDYTASLHLPNAAPVNPIDPNSLVAGYLVGCRLRANR